MTSVNVRYYAAAKAASGVSEEQVQYAGPLTSGDVVDLVAAKHGPAMVDVLMRSSYLLNELVVRGPAIEVPDGATFDVLPPFAGG